MKWTRDGFVFSTADDANAWEAVRRMADEAGWRVEADGEAVEALRACTVQLKASREKVTRQQFIARLVREARAGGIVLLVVS